MSGRNFRRRRKSSDRKKDTTVPDQGEEAELVLVKILTSWKRKRKLFEGRRRVVDPIHARKSDRLDAEGIDILIMFDSGLAMPLQIKKSSRLKLGHHRSRHPYILFVFGVGELPAGPSDYEAYSRISNNLEDFINSALRGHLNAPV